MCYIVFKVVPKLVNWCLLIPPLFFITFVSSTSVQFCSLWAFFHSEEKREVVWNKIKWISWVVLFLVKNGHTRTVCALCISTLSWWSHHSPLCHTHNVFLLLCLVGVLELIDKIPVNLNFSIQLNIASSSGCKHTISFCHQQYLKKRSVLISKCSFQVTTHIHSQMFLDQPWAHKPQIYCNSF